MVLFENKLKLDDLETFVIEGQAFVMCFPETTPHQIEAPIVINIKSGNTFTVEYVKSSPPY